MSNIDDQTQAAKSFYREIRLFSERTKAWEPALFHEITPDEIWDATLVSSRVYGRRDEFLAVMAAAGNDTIDQPLAQKKLVLPTEAQLFSIKKKCVFESRSEYRDESGAPTWVD